jgi:FkbM family methyltransferase
MRWSSPPRKSCGCREAAGTVSNVHAYAERAPGAYQAQHGEDRWLERYFRGRPDGFFVEVGAYDGVVLSNTYFLESIGWRGILVEPIPEKASRCRLNRPQARVFECAAVAPGSNSEIAFEVVDGGEVYSTSSMSPEHTARVAGYGLRTRKIVVPARTLDSILEEVHPVRVDYVSIDVEGAEVEVLRGFDIGRWRPRVVMIEVNTRTRAAALRELFTSHGYVYLSSIGINDVYVPLTEFKALARGIDYLRYSVALLRKAGRFARRNVLGRAGKG